MDESALRPAEQITSPAAAVRWRKKRVGHGRKIVIAVLWRTNSTRIHRKKLRTNLQE